MEIGWNIVPDINIASFRYRCMIPQRGLKKLGYSSIYGLAPITVFSKHFVNDDVDSAQEVKRRGGKVIYDICDNHFNSVRSAHYMKMSELADRIVCPTAKMAEIIKAHTGRDASVVGDPYEYPLMLPKVNKVNNILWFGHRSNLPSLVKEMPNLDGYSLMVVSEVDEIPGAKVMRWSRENMMQAFIWADVVIIPISESAKTEGKSPNRMVESIRQGKYVVANELDSYSPYGMWAGNISEGLLWASENKNAAIEKIADGQKIVEELNSPDVIAKQWSNIFESL